MIKTILQCPNCLKALKQGEKQYFCPKGHSFDIARKGYVNLLLSSHTGAGNPGDTKEMLQSRRDFLNKGYYEAFSDSINSTVSLADITSCNNEQPAGGKDSPAKGINILDAGCGDGYYISRLKKKLTGEKEKTNICFYGTDVSKDAINYAAGRDKNIRFAVASSYHLPVLNNTLDYILCIFAPRDEQEFKRILKPSGRLIVAVPGRRHLFSLKERMYELPEEIGVKGTVKDGFKLIEERNVHYEIFLNDKQDIMNLFRMTPYYRHADVQAIEKLDRLDTEVDINILIYERV